MLIGPNGQQINANDYQMLQEMLTGSLEQHIANLNISAHNPEFLHPEFFTPAINVYEEGLAFLPNGLRNAMESQEEINVTDFIHNMYGDLGKETLLAMKSNLANPEMLEELNLLVVRLGDGDGQFFLVGVLPVINAEVELLFGQAEILGNFDDNVVFILRDVAVGIGDGHQVDNVHHPDLVFVLRLRHNRLFY